MKFWILAGVVVVFLAGGLSLYASSSPDGLERVAEDHGFISASQDSAVAGSPLADYSIAGADSALSAVGAGLAGVAITAIIGFGVFFALRGSRT